MDLVEKMMGMFGGFGMKDVQDKSQKEALDKFNKMCLEFALKLDGSVGIEHSDRILKVVVQVAKHSDSSVCDNFLRMLRSRGELFEQRNPAFLELFPIKAKVDYERMDSQTKGSIWAYMKSMKKLAEGYKKACSENPLEELKNIKLDGIFGETIAKVNDVLDKHKVDKSQMVKIIGEVFDCLPIDDLVSQVPSGALPSELGINLDEMKQEKMGDQLTKLLRNVFECD